MSSGNIDPSAEGVWRFPKTYNGKASINFALSHGLSHTYITQAKWPRETGPYGFTEELTNIGYSQTMEVDFSSLQLPHMGMASDIGYVRQSSDYSHNNLTREGTADDAVDGSVNGNFSQGSVSHTDKEAYPYWEIDLGESQATKTIDKIEVWNRTDCCNDRLASYYILVSDKPFPKTWTGKSNPKAKSKGQRSIDEAGTKKYSHVSKYFVTPHGARVSSTSIRKRGRYIRIINDYPDTYLNLAEVRIIELGSH